MSTQPVIPSAERGGVFGVAPEPELIDEFRITKNRWSSVAEFSVGEFYDQEKLALQGKPSEVSITKGASLNILLAGGRRGRFMLTMLGSALLEGDEYVAAEVGLAVELQHAYFKVIDDIDDNARVRNGILAAHAQVADVYHLLGGHRQPTKSVLNNNTRLAAETYYQKSLERLSSLEDVEPERLLAVLGIITSHAIPTAEGQIMDNFAPFNSSHKTEQEVLIQTVLKTAHYSVLAPLQAGLASAGGTEQDFAAIVDFGTYFGTAFQIEDDLKVVTGNLASEGKDPASDIREGKQTVLTAHALDPARVTEGKITRRERRTLQRALGRKSLTNAQFVECREVLVRSGAADRARELTGVYRAAALRSLHKQALSTWDPKAVDFLGLLAR